MRGTVCDHPSSQHAHNVFSDQHSTLCLCQHIAATMSNVCLPKEQRRIPGVFLTACQKDPCPEMAEFPTISQYQTRSWCHIAIVSFNKRDLASPVFFHEEISSLRCVYLPLFHLFMHFELIHIKQIIPSKCSYFNLKSDFLRVNTCTDFRTQK